MPGITPGRPTTELDRAEPDATAHLDGGLRTRMATAELARSFTEKGVRSTILRLPPTVHDDGDHGFTATLVGIARATGVSAYLGDGTNRWPAVHRDDAAGLFRLALEGADAGSTLHAAADEGVEIRTVAEIIGRWLGGLLAADLHASSALTRQWTGWAPTGPRLAEDLEKGHYFQTT